MKVLKTTLVIMGLVVDIAMSVLIGLVISAILNGGSFSIIFK